jgi:hypothetical protein
MGIEVRFKNDIDIVNKSDAPHNSKFGDPQNLQEAIQAARDQHQAKGGKPTDVDGEDVVIVARGDNLWKIWETHAKPQGITWEEFLASNKHLQQPTNLSGGQQSGWKPYHLVHEGDVVFIPEGPTPADAAQSYAQGVSSGSADKAAGNLTADMNGMNPAERATTLSTILSNPNISAANKQKATLAYLDSFKTPQEREQAMTTLLRASSTTISDENKKLAVKAYLETFATPAEKAAALKALNYGEYQGRDLVHPAQALLESIKNELQLNVDFAN